METFLFYYLFVVTEVFKKVNKFLSFSPKGLVRNPHHKRICSPLYFIHSGKNSILIGLLHPWVHNGLKIFIEKLGMTLSKNVKLSKTEDSSMSVWQGCSIKFFFNSLKIWNVIENRTHRILLRFLPALAWGRGAPRRTPPAHSQSHHRMWSFSGTQRRVCSSWAPSPKA